MSVIFNGNEIFGSGPSRVIEEQIGVAVLQNSRITPTDPTSTAIGLKELDVKVEGRLIGTDWSALDQLIAQIALQLTYPPTAGVLIDSLGRVWENMSFISFEPTGTIDFGRMASLQYVARFRRFSI